MPQVDCEQCLPCCVTNGKATCVCLQIVNCCPQQRQHELPCMYHMIQDTGD